MAWDDDSEHDVEESDIHFMLLKQDAPPCPDAPVKAEPLELSAKEKERRREIDGPALDGQRFRINDKCREATKPGPDSQADLFGKTGRVTGEKGAWKQFAVDPSCRAGGPASIVSVRKKWLSPIEDRATHEQEDEDDGGSNSAPKQKQKKQKQKQKQKKKQKQEKQKKKRHGTAKPRGGGGYCALLLPTSS